MSQVQPAAGAITWRFTSQSITALSFALPALRLLRVARLAPLASVARGACGVRLAREGPRAVYAIVYVAAPFGLPAQGH